MEETNSSLKVYESSSEYVSKVFMPRQNYSRKGENGVVAVIGGSWLYHGAPTLAALAALRSGVDLVYVAVPRVISTSVRTISPNFIVIPLPDAKLTLGCAKKLLKWLPRVDAVVLGPGLGSQRIDGIQRLVSELTSRNIKILLDADALNRQVISQVKGKEVVITPHAGEFKKLFDVELGPTAEERIEIVKQKAYDNTITILLKGHIDVISDGNVVFLNRTGSPAMTVGGTGDVLAGIVAGIMSKGKSPLEASVAGAYVNGLAGERVAERLGFHILATDIIDELPYVMKNLEINH